MGIIESLAKEFRNLHPTPTSPESASDKNMTDSKKVMQRLSLN
jgi:hypothetical protein